MLDLIGAIVGMSAVGINLVAFTHALPGTPARRLGLAAIAGAWVGLAIGLGATFLLFVLPFASMTRALRGKATSPRLPTALMRSPPTTMTASSIGARPVASMSVPPWMTSGVAFCA